MTTKNITESSAKDWHSSIKTSVQWTHCAGSSGPSVYCGARSAGFRIEDQGSRPTSAVPDPSCRSLTLRAWRGKCNKLITYQWSGGVQILHLAILQDSRFEARFLLHFETPNRHRWLYVDSRPSFSLSSLDIHPVKYVVRNTRS